MDTLLKLLRDDASLKPAQLAAMLNLPEAEVVGKIKALEADGIGLGRRDGGVRMVTAWSTTNEEVDHVVARAKAHGARAAA